MERKIRFATGIIEFSRNKGGAERYLADFCRQMASKGHEVHVYAERRKEEDPGIHFHPVKTLPFPKSLRLLSFALRATKEMKEGNYDITFGVGNTLGTDVIQPHGGVHWAWFWRSLRAYGNPALWTMKFLGRVLSPKQWAQGWIEDSPYRGKTLPKMIAISEMVRQDMRRWYEIAEEGIVVIYNGVNTERFHPRNRKYREEIRDRFGIGEETVLLFVSNNFRMKGLGYLMRALSLMKKEDPAAFKLLILGRDRQEPYQRLAGRLGISGETIFAGSTEEPEKFYGGADLLVHPTFYDACSLTVLEALASGLPVITTTSNGASGMIREGVEGWVIERPTDVEELTRTLQIAFKEHSRLYLAPSEKERREAYSERKNFDQVIGVLEEVLKDKEARFPLDR